MPADQVTAEDEEEIDTDPAETVCVTGKREAHDAGVVKNDNDDGERAEQIETGLALAVLKARIDFRRKRSEAGGQGVTKR